MKQVYFAQTDTGVIKVGCTKDVFERMKTLKYQSGFDMTLLKSRNFPDSTALDVERLFIKRFEGYRTDKKKREWFIPSKKVLSFISLVFPDAEHVCTGQGEYGCCEHKKRCQETPAACSLEGHWIGGVCAKLQIPS